MLTDPISDMLTRIRNAQAVRKTELNIPFSKLKFSLGKILEQEGFVEKVEQTTEVERPVIRVVLKYSRREPAIRLIKRISKPGRRVYVKTDGLPWVLSGLGIAIISTSNGLMTNKEARARKLGGEVLCEVA
ncbi:MAG: 30S ribosomal protein S8 [Candidatus Uhrbacteria bacterium GW2011_GWE2_45_35]|uniref:Small ribosomal subunit protein uS8 n=2 Tax=Candidatus Uhriibacteriota TaxID=1752732 RepID=A0A0G1JKV5_9BACT|nr:MAG: 30S ribosomal protein S8 [Candidatus Uhrbacteria bacterium GW2011_GWF2_44_350]KKU09241.1 MAG: 30S ribosomal protein S8 [Candidatus Uhrbacteria bacterium GW2011_GWE2_45_35]